MLLTFNLADEGDQPPPLIKLQRTTDGGLFDRLADNLDTLWNNADETLLTDPRQSTPTSPTPTKRPTTKTRTDPSEIEPTHRDRIDTPGGGRDTHPDDARSRSRGAGRAGRAERDTKANAGNTPASPPARRSSRSSRGWRSPVETGAAHALRLTGRVDRVQRADWSMRGRRMIRGR